mgnify:CR=1 FL=1
MKQAFRKPVAILGLALVIGLTSCASYLENVAKAGDALAVAGDLFVATGNLYDGLYRDGRINESEYDQWREFAVYFKKAFPAAVEAWKTLKAHPDADSGQADDILDLITDMSTKLFEYYIKAFAKTSGGS